MNSIKDQKNLNKKKVLLRLDLNVPLKNGSITDETRINKIIPIIDFLIKEQSKIIIISHVGRPNGKVITDLSLKPSCENVEKKIPALPISSHGVDYYLKVKGDSMIDVGIFENDLIAVNKDLKIKKNAIVIARLDDDVTVKTLKELSDNKIVLKAENKNYKDIVIDPNKVSLNFEGTCIGLIRNMS